jgi:hypothetical protein
MPDDYAGLQAAVLIHIADGDQFNPPTLADELAERSQRAPAESPRSPTIPPAMPSPLPPDVVYR